MRKLLCLAALPLLAACDSGIVTSTVQDPNATACRQQGALTMRVPFSETSAQPVNTNIRGTTNIDVQAGGLTFRCSVNEAGQIVRFTRV